MITLTAEQAQQIEEALEDIVRVFKFETGTPVEALASIRAARAQEQAEQEPVAYFMDVKAGFSSKPLYEQVSDEYKNDADVFPLYAAPQPMKQEPVGYIDAGDLRELSNGNERQYSLFAEDKGRIVAIYAAPVRTKDLTDDEIDEFSNNLVAVFPKAHHLRSLARAVIAADREKNK